MATLGGARVGLGGKGRESGCSKVFHAAKQNEKGKFINKSMHTLTQRSSDCVCSVQRNNDDKKTSKNQKIKHGKIYRVKTR